jgi:hypothetical protein
MLITTCRECKARIFFAVTEAGRRMPIDEAPVKGGNVCVSMNGEGEDPTATPITPNDSLAYVSHFATCTNPKRFRKADRQRRLL